MRVLFTTQPGVGHFHPLVPLARALLAAGHAVAVACAPSFAPLVEVAGLTARPPAFQGAPLPPTHHSFHTPVFDRSVAANAPAWAAGPLPPPVVYATLGTAHGAPTLLAAILAGMREVAGTLVLTVGGAVDQAALGPQPPHLHVERYVPQSLLFPRCDLVVAHGGSGTLVAALEHGLPLVLIPLMADQPENAARAAALGLGRVVGPDERTPEAISAAVRAVLADPAYRASARHVREELASLPGPEYAVALLERLARDKEPLLAPA